MSPSSTTLCCCCAYQSHSADVLTLTSRLTLDTRRPRRATTSSKARARAPSTPHPQCPHRRYTTCATRAADDRRQQKTTTRTRARAALFGITAGDCNVSSNLCREDTMRETETGCVENESRQDITSYPTDRSRLTDCSTGAAHGTYTRLCSRRRFPPPPRALQWRHRRRFELDKSPRIFLSMLTHL